VPFRSITAHAVETSRWRAAFLSSLLLTLPTFLVGMVLPMWPPAAAVLSRPVWGGATTAGTAAKWALVTPVQFGVGARFHSGALAALRRGAANMDVLVSLGTNAAYFASAASVIHCAITGHDVRADFFDTCGMVITVILLGKYLEAAAKGRTGDAIARLLTLAPSTALLLEAAPGWDAANGVGGAERLIDAALVARGDVLRVPPGARLPADGRVVWGSSHVDESMLTGEAAPARKRPGDAVTGGTLNAAGTLHVRATAVGADTTLAHIAALVANAQLAKAPIQGFADALSARFVPAVVALAAAVHCGWWAAGATGALPPDYLPPGVNHFMFALLFAIAVLVTACPCALGLATPTAVMVATGVGAAHGILIKGGDALERAGRVGTVVFDKTGTLTAGAPAVTSRRLFGGGGGGGGGGAVEVLRAVAAAEACADHPLVGALLTHARLQLTAHAGGARLDADFDAEDEEDSGGAADADAKDDADDVDADDADDVSSRVWGRGAGGASRPAWMAAAGVPLASDSEALPGLGVRATLPDGAPVLVGSAALLATRGVSLPPDADAFLEAAEARARTCVAVALRGQLVALFAVSDPVRPEAAVRAPLSFLRCTFCGGLHFLFLRANTYLAALTPGCVCVCNAGRDCCAACARHRVSHGHGRQRAHRRRRRRRGGHPAGERGRGRAAGWQSRRRRRAARRRGGGCRGGSQSGTRAAPAPPPLPWLRCCICRRRHQRRARARRRGCGHGHRRGH
jgi:Cu+-exporting ATPase